MTAQELFDQAAEATAKGLGERHGYSMLVGGLERMLQPYGFTTQEIAFWVHRHELSDYLEMAARQQVDVKAFAKAFDLVWVRRPEPSWDLRAAMEGRDNSYFPFLSQRPHVEWIENEVAKSLRERKLRRGTKRYHEFITTNAHRVLAAVRQEIEAAARRKQDAIAERLAELGKRREGFVLGAAALNRQLAFRRALLEVTEQLPDPRAEEGAALAEGHFSSAIAALDEAIAYLQQELAESAVVTDSAVLEVLGQSKELAPFGPGQVRACDCEG